MKILVFDNYDSFTYNLVHYLEKVSDADIEVHRNDKISLKEIERFDKILLSPGPGIPSEAGILLDVIKTYAPTKDILGVCLGQQAIAEAFGGSLNNLQEVFHGVATPIDIIAKDVIFKDVPQKLNVGRYHSWAVNEKDFPKELEITAVDQSGSIMALRHRSYQVRGVQFHPESVLTEHGELMIKNWIENVI
jgi:anthranilate synthase component II